MLASKQTKYLNAVDELSQRNVALVTKDVGGVVSPILGLEAQEVTVIGK
jgi:hypothetical protein